MTEFAEFGVTETSIKGSFSVVGIFLLQLGEILGRFFPLSLNHIKAAQFEDGLRIDRSAIGLTIIALSVLKVIRPLGIAFAQLHALYIGLEGSLRDLGGFLNELILGKGQGLISLVENLVSNSALDVLERCE